MLWRMFKIAAVGCVAFGIALTTEVPTADDLYARGSAAFNKKNYAEAADLFQGAERERPKSTDALVLRAKALIHLERYGEAEQALRDYLAVHEHSADATYLLAYVLFRRGRPAQSLQTYTAAARLQRPTGDDLKIVGLDYVLLNDYPDAIRWLQRAAAEEPNEAEIFYHLGRAYYVQNNFDNAIAMFTRCLLLDGHYLKAKNNLGLALEGKNQLDKAENAYREAIQLGKDSGKETDQSYINLAQLLSHKNRLPEALQLVEKAEQVGGKSERAEELRGKILLLQNRLGEAEQAFRGALALDARNGSLHYQLGRVLRREGKEDEAKLQFEQTKTLLGTHSSQN